MFQSFFNRLLLLLLLPLLLLLLLPLLLLLLLLLPLLLLLLLLLLTSSSSSWILFVSDADINFELWLPLLFNKLVSAFFALAYVCLSALLVANRTTVLGHFLLDRIYLEQAPSSVWPVFGNYICLYFLPKNINHRPCKKVLKVLFWFLPTLAWTNFIGVLW